MTKTKKILIISAILILLIPFQVYASAISREGIINLTNSEREKIGLSPLVENGLLDNAAQRKAQDMIDRDYWEHYYQGKTPWDWMHESGYFYLDAGENLAIDFDSLEPMVAAWMNSPTHRENIVNPTYKDIGVGIASGDYEGHQTIIVVQMFGNPVSESSLGAEASGVRPETPAFGGIEAQADINIFEGRDTEDTTQEEKGTLEKIFTSIIDFLVEGEVVFRSFINRITFGLL